MKSINQSLHRSLKLILVFSNILYVLYIMPNNLWLCDNMVWVEERQRIRLWACTYTKWNYTYSIANTFNIIVHDQICITDQICIWPYITFRSFLFSSTSLIDFGYLYPSNNNVKAQHKRLSNECIHVRSVSINKNNCSVQVWMFLAFIRCINIT